MTLDQIRTKAQRAADRDREPSVILDLNRAGGHLYVIRDPWPDCETHPDFVERITPNPEQPTCR